MHRTSLAGAIGLFLAVGHVYGGISATSSLALMSQNANLIVVGAASSGVHSANTVSFALQVSRVVKGSSAVAGSAIQVDWAPVTLAGIAPAVTGNGIWFLRSSPSGWAVLPVRQGFVLPTDLFLPQPPGPILSAYAYDPGAPVSDKIASEISSAIESAHGGDASDGLLNLQREGALDELNSSVVQLLYRRMSVSSQTGETILGLSGLIRGGNTAALSSAIRIAPTLGNNLLQAGVLFASVREAFRATDSNSVNILGQAAVDTTNPSLAFREACAHALRSIHTAAALPYLGALLDDPDLNLQSEAVGGFSAFTNGLPVQTTACVPSLSCLQRSPAALYRAPGTISNFAMGPGAYQRASFWKTWWAQNRSALGY